MIQKEICNSVEKIEMQEQLDKYKCLGELIKIEVLHGGLLTKFEYHTRLKYIIAHVYQDDDTRVLKLKFIPGMHGYTQFLETIIPELDKLIQFCTCNLLKLRVTNKHSYGCNYNC